MPKVGAAAKPADPWAGFAAVGTGNATDSGAGGEFLGKAMNFVVNNWHSGEHPLGMRLEHVLLLEVRMSCLPSCPPMFMPRPVRPLQQRWAPILLKILHPVLHLHLHLQQPVDSPFPGYDCDNWWGMKLPNSVVNHTGFCTWEL